MEFTFHSSKHVPAPVDSTAIVPEESEIVRPSVHFELDLANPVDHATAVVLVDRAMKVWAMLSTGVCICRQWQCRGAVGGVYGRLCRST